MAEQDSGLYCGNRNSDRVETCIWNGAYSSIRERIADVWKQLFPAEQQRIAQLLIERVDFKDGSLDIHWREDGWIGLDPSIVAHPYVEEAKEYAEEVMA